MIRLPKAPHLDGSKSAKLDSKLNPFESKEFLSNRTIFQEKLDGYSVQLYITKYGTISLKHGNKSVPNQPKFKPLKKWTDDHESLLINYLGTDYAIFGEWLFDRNVVFYNNLPDFFLIHDVYDKENETFWCTERVLQLCSLLDIHTVPTTIIGVFEVQDISQFAVRDSTFGEDSVEGVYMRLEDEHRVIERAQYIPADSPRRTSKKNKRNIRRDDG